MLVVLGSGGHTTEMLYALQNFKFGEMQQTVFALATTDTTSIGKTHKFFESNRVTPWNYAAQHRQHPMV